LGAALSGGIDSSSIVCAIRHLEPEIPITTFSYIASDSKISEEKWVDEVNFHVNALPHKIYSNSQNLIEDIDEMILAQGEPFGGTSIYAQYQVFRCARDNDVVVTLDGQGADELLAGYNGYPGKRLKSLIESRRFSEAKDFLVNWPSWPGRSYSYCLKQLISEYADGDVYGLLRHLNRDNNSPSWINKKILTDNDVFIRFPEKEKSTSKKGRRVVSAMASSISGRGLPALLRHGDRNSMHFSVESRVPFLTIEIANFLLSLPEHYLISQSGETKSVFRAAMRGIVPDSILDRKDKIGFATPEENLLLDLSNQIISWLNFDVKLSFLNQAELLKEFNMILYGKKPYSPRVWRWVNFIRWYQLNFEIK
jgi:asparagine synthase (glutamine-hydrolysing)